VPGCVGTGTGGPAAVTLVTRACACGAPAGANIRVGDDGNGRGCSSRRFGCALGVECGPAAAAEPHAHKRLLNQVNVFDGEIG
jgi:hypothetical protein